MLSNRHYRPFPLGDFVFAFLFYYDDDSTEHSIDNERQM
jgi:hypothetical protein